MTVETPISNQKLFSKEKPFGGKKRLCNIVQVQFRTNHLKEDVDARELQLTLGEEVIVHTARGPVIAKVTSHVHRKVMLSDNLAHVVRKAAASDINQAEKNESLEIEAYRFAIERIRARKLPMKLIRAQYMHDGSKIVFFFSADGRIDFRDLVKDLAHRFRTRIEMHQIGVRDGARMLGGIGPCGRELCCSTFLDNFAPVSIRMAKDQGLTLNPKKVSGMCGRLMCCLVYEQQIYRRMRSKLPRAGQDVKTELGTAQVIDVDVINRRMTVQFADGNRKAFNVNEVAILNAGQVNDTVDEEPLQDSDDEFLWDDDETRGNEKKEARESRRASRGSQRRRRSRSQRKATQGATNKDSAENTQKASGEGAETQESEAPKKKKSSRQRRRNSKRSSKSQKKDNQPRRRKSKSTDRRKKKAPSSSGQNDTTK